MIELSPGAPMSAYQDYIHQLEAMHGWLEVDLVHNCFLMGEEVGELFKAIRKYEAYFNALPETEQACQSAHAGDPRPPVTRAAEKPEKQAVAEELVDVMNYLMALANRLDIDLEAAFREKNARNQKRRWV